VFVAVGSQHVERMSCVFSICGLSGCIIFFNIITQMTWFSGKNLNIKCVFWISPQNFTETFRILRRIQRNIIVNIHTYLCKVRVIFVVCLLLLNLFDIFSKNTQISNFTKIHPVEAESLHAARRTDKHEEVNNIFRNCAKAPKNWSFARITVNLTGKCGVPHYFTWFMI